MSEIEQNRKVVDAWKEAGGELNRLKPVKFHKELMDILDQEFIDFEDVRYILKHLVKATIPVSDFELKLLEQIMGE